MQKGRGIGFCFALHRGIRIGSFIVKEYSRFQKIIEISCYRYKLARVFILIKYDEIEHKEDWFLANSCKLL